MHMMQLYLTISVAGLHGSSNVTEMDTFKPGLKAWKVWCYFTELSDDKISSLEEQNFIAGRTFAVRQCFYFQVVSGMQVVSGEEANPSLRRPKSWIHAAD